MAVIYDAALKDARMALVREVLAGGLLEIGTIGMKDVLASFPLDNPVGEVRDGALLLSGFPKFGVLQRAGTPARAQFRDAAGVVRISGLTAGVKDADVVIESGELSGRSVLKIARASLWHA